MSCCDAFYLEETKEDFALIETLDLSNTYITTFPKELCSYLDNVHSLVLSKNNLGNTPLRFLDTLFRLPLLEAVDLSCNLFSYQGWIRIDALLPLLNKLKSINLRNTNLKDAPPEFFKTLFELPHLQKVDLSSNGFSIAFISKIHREAIPKGISVKT
jgi:Leucine-rich repeat (LRR) protein